MQLNGLSHINRYLCQPCAPVQVFLSFEVGPSLPLNGNASEVLHNSLSSLASLCSWRQECI